MTSTETATCTCHRPGCCSRAAVSPAAPTSSALNLHELITMHQHPALAQSLRAYVAARLPAFRDVYQAHPIEQPDIGCISADEAFWLFCLVQDLKPAVIIESGTFEGYSLYFLHRAAPHAEIHAFDPFTKPRHIPDGVHHHRYDWMRHRFGRLPSDRTLAFFDDHLNHGRRLAQARRRGLRHLVFHDNYVTPAQSHVPLRYCNLLGLARHCYTFDRLDCDALFTATSRNPQNYRWLTYVELEVGRGLWWRWLRRWRQAVTMRNPFLTH